MSFKSFLEKIKPETFFVSFALLFGTLLLFITPPFQIPDEPNHFYRAYQISEGNFISIKKDNRVGGDLPLSCVKITEHFMHLRWNDKSKISITGISSHLKEVLKEEERVFADFPNTAMYSFISYLPQAFAIFISRCFSLTPLWMFYFARLFTLLFWVFGVYVAIKIIPIYKWLFTFLALLPMSLFINMSLSADMVTNMLAFLLIAYSFKLAFSEQIVSNKNFLVMVLLSILLASAKLVYTPLLCLFLIIPKEKFGSRKDFYLKMSLLCFVSIVTICFWSRIINNLFIPYEFYNPAFREGTGIANGANVDIQLNFVLKNMGYFFNVIVSSLIKTFDMYFEGYIGTFGWLDSRLPLWLIRTTYFIIFLVAIMENNKNITLSIKKKIILLFSFIGSLVLLLLSQYLTWSIVGIDVIGTIQGRYLIPFLPLMFMLFYNTKINYSRFVASTVMFVSLVIGLITIYTLIQRYYD